MLLLTKMEILARIFLPGPLLGAALGDLASLAQIISTILVAVF